MIKEKVIGNCRLILGDCREIIPNLGRFDAVVTDPPYGIGIAANPVRQAHSKKDWDSDPIDDSEIQIMIGCSKEQIIWGENYFRLSPSRGFIIWDKKQPKDFSLAMCEFAYWSRDTNAKIFRYSVTSYAKEHPTQKPVELMQFCLDLLGGGTVLDPYMGSGTTLVACATRGLTGVGVERDPEYFETACRRVEDAYRQPDLFVAPPDPDPPQPQLFDMT